nr:glutaminyl-peptide cyclotransferase [Aldersonia kunmingensis]
MRVLRAFLVTIIGATLAWGCSGPTASTAPTPVGAPLRMEIVSTRPHDPAAFTQGFEVVGRTLVEGTGLVGKTWVSATDLVTGQELRRVPLSGMFGEGITSTGNSLWQITWQNRTAIERDPVTLEERRRVAYVGEGWGLCMHEASGRLIMSNGSNTLQFRDPVTFDPVGTVNVVGFGNMPLNELECAEDGTVYANIWQRDTILRIDPNTGGVLSIIDASALRRQIPGKLSRDSVLNGIAQIPGTDRFLLTGKNWPTTFEVRFVG